MLDSVLEAGQEVGAQIGGFVSGLLTPEEPGHDAEANVGRQSERAAAMLADTRSRLAGLEQVTFTAAELATINSCVARLRGQGVELPGLIEPEDVGEGLFDVAGTSLAALATAIPMPLPIPLPGPWLILGIIALIILLLLTLMRGIERARERERERERDRDRTGPPCRGASALLDDVRALLTRTIEQDAEIFLRYHIGRDPTTCSDPSNQRRLRSRYFWHMLHVCQVGVMQACDRQGRLLAYAPGVKGVGTGGALHAEDIALRAIEPMLLAIPMPARAGGKLWSVTIDRACGRCNPTVTGAAATLLAGTPVFAHLGSRFMELRSRTDPAFDLAWAKLCAGAPAPGPGPGPAPAPTGMAVPAEDEEPAEEELVIA
jgi:hypothetical protein